MNNKKKVLDDELARTKEALDVAAEAIGKIIQFNPSFNHVHFDYNDLTKEELAKRCPECNLKIALTKIEELRK